MNFEAYFYVYTLTGLFLGLSCGLIIALIVPYRWRLLTLGSAMVSPIVLFTLWGTALGCVIDGIGNGRECVGWRMLFVMVIIAIMPGWLLGGFLGFFVTSGLRKRKKP